KHKRKKVELISLKYPKADEIGNIGHPLQEC
ncbi:hypothetical protein DBR06_SOUSAS39110016, partial [Sousa chinensis]